MDIEEWKKCEIEADKRMKESNGHSFVTMLKTRCQYCGRSPKVTTRCGGWFHSYRARLTEVLLERGFMVNE